MSVHWKESLMENASTEHTVIGKYRYWKMPVLIIPLRSANIRVKNSSTRVLSFDFWLTDIRNRGAESQTWARGQLKC